MNTRGRHRSTVLSFAAALLLGACGDDGGTSQDTDVASTGGTSGATEGSGGGSDSTTTSVGSTSVGATSDDGGSSSTDADGSSSSGADESSSTGGEPEGEWGALVLGTLSTDDLDMARQTHDAVAMGGQEAAMMAGDFGHDALLGTSLLGTTENQFLGIDQWTNLGGALAVYGDPEFQAAFGMLFGEPPSLELFAKRDDWYGWGSLEAGDGDDHWYVVIRGRLADEDLDAAQTAHDTIAQGGEAAATALGDVAHVVWVGTPEDPNAFFAVDVWTDDTMIETFYGNPKFAKAFGALFEAPPTVGVYGSTDWHQW